MLSSTTALETARALLAGELPLAESLGLKIKYQPSIDDPQLLWLFQCENLLQDYSERNFRCLVVPRGILAPDEEGALDNDHRLDPELVARAFNAAAQSVFQTFSRLAEEEDALSCRFRARLCVACRDELSALLVEHAEMTTPEVA